MQSLPPVEALQNLSSSERLFLKFWVACFSLSFHKLFLQSWRFFWQYVPNFWCDFFIGKVSLIDWGLRFSESKYPVVFTVTVSYAIIFFVCYLVAPWLTLSCYRWNNFTHPMLITTISLSAIMYRLLFRYAQKCTFASARMHTYILEGLKISRRSSKLSPPYWL